MVKSIPTEEIIRKMSSKPDVTGSISHMTTPTIMKHVSAIIDRLVEVNGLAIERLSPILTPELPSCPETDVAENSQGSPFFSELMLKLNAIDNRISDLEATINRIEV